MKKIYMFLSCCLVFAAMTFLSTGRLFAQCDPIEITQTDIFFEDFSSFQAIDSLNGEGVMPTCWNKIYNGATAGYDPKVYNGSSAVVSGDNCIAITSGRSAFLGFLEQYNAGEANYVIFPFITNGFNELQLMFTSKMSSTADGTLEIGYITDITDDSTFVALTTVSSTTAATSQSILISSLLREPLRQDAYLAFCWRNSSTSNASTCYIDNVTIRKASACGDPSNITVSNISDISAVVGWTAASNDQSQWEISCNGNIIRNVTTNPYTLTDLTANTEYTVNVRAVCGEDTSYWSGQTVTFSTTCPAIIVTGEDIYFEDFSSYVAVDSLGNTGVIPDCWNKFYTGSSNGYDPKVFNGSSAIVPGDNCIAFTSGVSSLLGFWTLYNAGAENYIILPNIANELGDLQILFTSKMSTDTAGVLELGYFSDLSSTSNFVMLTTIPSTTVATNQIINLSSLQGTVGLHARLAFCWRDNHTTSYSNCYIDNITLRKGRECGEPSDITVSNISDVSAQVNWVAASPSQNLWEISVNDEIIQNVTTNPYMLTGLTAETEYVVNVRAVCSDETSYWAAQSVTFTTACPAIAVDDEHPFTEGFEGADLGCWATEVTDGLDNWTLDYGAFHSGNKGIAYSSSVFGDLTNMGDDFMAILDMFQHMTNFGNGSARLTSPILDLSAVTGQVRLSFFRKQTTMMIPQYLFVYYRTSPNSQWVMLQQYNPTSDWIGESIVLPNPSATYQVSFVSYCDISSMGNIDPTSFMDPDAATNFASNIYIDDIRVGYAIVCENPTDLSFSNITTTSATATWGGTADNWTVEYGPVGFTTGTGTTVTAQNPTYTFTGLTPGTSYDVHVRANCPENVFSDWVQSYFTTENEIGINENGSPRLSISPNPTTGTVRCTLSNITSNTRLQVLDVYGKLLMEKEVSSQTTELDFSDKASGIYFLRVVNGNTIVTTQKIIRR